MAVCDISPQVKKGNSFVESELFPSLVATLPGGREHAKRVYSDIFDDNFLAWYGDWTTGEQKPALTYKNSGEPLLLSPQTSSAIEFALGSALVGNKPYGKGVYFGPPSGDSLQAGFIKVTNPVRPEAVTAESLSEKLSTIFPRMSDNVRTRLQKVESQSLQKVTTELEGIVRQLEYDNANTVWSNRSDITNVWELFGYDGIVDGDTYVVFSPFDYWAAWNNEHLNQVISDPIHKDNPEGPSREERVLDMLKKKFNTKVVYDTSIPEGTIARVRQEGGQPVIYVHPDRIQGDTYFHEFAHIFIDGIGGLSNPQIKRGIQLLEGTDLWSEVAGRYSDRSQDYIAKEVLAEAMGREMKDMMVSDPNLITQIQNWLELLFDRIRRVFGLQTNEVKQLSREVLSERLSTKFSTENLPQDYQEQRSKAKARQKVLDRKNQVYEETLLQIDHRIQELRQRDDRASIRELERVKHELRKDLEKEFVYSGMIYYLNQSMQDLDTLFTEMYNSIQDGSITAEQLLQIYTSSQAYNTLPDIKYIVEADPEMAKALGPEYVQNLDFTEGLFKKINRFFSEESKELAVDFLKPYARRKRRQIEMEYQREWRDKNPRSRYQGRMDQYQRDMNQYVARRMEAEKTSIDNQIENDLRQQLEEAQQDVGSMELWMTAMKNVDHEVLQIVAEAVDKAEYKVIREGNALKYEIDQRVEDLKAYKGHPVDPAKLFEDILETDDKGKPTGYVVSEYTSHFERLERAFLRSTERVRENDTKMWHIKRAEFYKEHGKKNPEYEAWEKDLRAARKRLDDTQFEEWKIENRPPREYFPADKYRNKKYNKLNPEHADYLGDDNPVVRFYQFYTDQMKKFDDMIPIESKQLGYRLPSIKRTMIERVAAGDFQGMVENLRDNYKWAVDDTMHGDIELELHDDAKTFSEASRKRDDATWEFLEDDFRGRPLYRRTAKDGSTQLYAQTKTVTRKNKYVPVPEDVLYVRTDANGNRLKYIPIHYRGSITPEHQSFDLGSLLLLNGHMSMNYKEKNSILAELQLVQEQMRARRVGQERGGKRLHLEAAKNRPSTILGEQSKAYLMLDEFLNFRMFDRHTTERDPLYDYAKPLGSLMSYTGMLLLGGNVLAGVANVALGESLFFAEGIAGQYFSVKNWKRAQSYYMKHMANMSILGDIGHHRYESIVNLLMDKYDALNSYNPISHKFADKNRFQRMLKQHHIYALNNTGEHMMHNMTLFALLDNIKITNQKGEWVDSEGKVTQDRGKAVSMLDKYKAEDGQLQFEADGQQAEWEGKFFQFGEDLDFRITQRVRQINEYLHGAYADQNSNYLQRFTLGRMSIMMRKWIEPGFRRRFAGIKGAWYGQKGMRWDQQLNDFHEGTVTTVYRYLRNSWHDAEGAKFALQANWNKMSDIERANIHRAVTEAAIMMVMFTFAKVMYNMARDAADDDEANRYWYLGYQANRLYSELVFYYPPASMMEMYRILKSPAATVSVIERTIRLGSQLFDPFDEYQSGRRKGELKIGKYAKDMFPFVGPIDRLKNMQDLVNIVYNP